MTKKKQGKKQTGLSIYSSSPRKVENQQALESQSTDYTLYTPIVGGKVGKLPYVYSLMSRGLITCDHLILGSRRL